MDALVSFFKSKYLYICILMYLLGDFFIGGPLKDKGLFSYIYLYFGNFSFVLGILVFINIIFSFVRNSNKKDVFSINIEFIMIGILSVTYIFFMLKMQIPFTIENATESDLKTAINYSLFDYNTGLFSGYLFYLLLSKLPYLYSYILLGCFLLLSISVVVFLPAIRTLIGYYAAERMEMEKIVRKNAKIIDEERRNENYQREMKSFHDILEKSEYRNISLSVEEIEELTKRALTDNNCSKEKIKPVKKVDTQKINVLENEFIKKSKNIEIVFADEKAKIKSNRKNEISIKDAKMDSLFVDLIGETEISNKKVAETLKKDFIENEKKSTFDSKKQSIIGEELRSKNEDILDVKFKKGEEALKTMEESKKFSDFDFSKLDNESSSQVRTPPKDKYISGAQEFNSSSRNSKIISISDYLKLSDEEREEVVDIVKKSFKK
ncbi:hypothetical protein [Fusobacterium sp. PH5-44]|uniref:hypothetical protein n=2 Tax=unclassified Fusobacterium TaxID=2648384 RepID=UPI003D194760